MYNWTTPFEKGETENCLSRDSYGHPAQVYLNVTIDCPVLVLSLITRVRDFYVWGKRTSPLSYYGQYILTLYRSAHMYI